MQKTLELNRTTILADFREKNSYVVEFLRRKPIALKFLDLEVGDYVVSEEVCVERKTANDFINSIIDGRLFEQAEALKRSYAKPVILIEGDISLVGRKIHPNAVKSAFVSLITDFDVHVIRTENARETSDILYWMAKREQTKKKSILFKKRNKKLLDEKGIKEMIVSSLPGVSSVIGRRLLEHFGNLEAIFSAKEEELMKVKGIGKNLAKKIRKILTEPYEVRV
ncbi:MAG: hypothetical protein J7K98_01065 [Candidatus Aenigmarchaeota archaeon]|nr:hypothetical protein [Candidatus Aenigmarchaeota archaeon]